MPVLFVFVMWYDYRLVCNLRKCEILVRDDHLLGMHAHGGKVLRGASQHDGLRGGSVFTSARGRTRTERYAAAEDNDSREAIKCELRETRASALLDAPRQNIALSSLND